MLLKQVVNSVTQECIPQTKVSAKNAHSENSHQQQVPWNAIPADVVVKSTPLVLVAVSANLVTSPRKEELANLVHF